MTRISATFTSLKSQNRAGLIPFVMGGDPSIATTLEILKSLKAAGADLIEIGMPFSDPMADGVAIQAAGLRALKAGATLAGILEMVSEYRKTDADTPLILMGYFNSIYHYGMETFCAEASKAGIDGTIIVDLPPEEEAEFKSHATAHGIDFIRLIAPTSKGERLKQLVASSSGFIYYISLTGITGAKTANYEDVAKQVASIKALTDLPIAVGFGIKTPEQVAEVAKFANAAVVGSALVDVIGKASENAPEKAGEFVAKLAKALKT